MALLDDLERRYGEGEPLETLVRVALDGLQSAEVMAHERETAAAALSALGGEWSALEQLSRAAWQRYPEYEYSGAHGMRPDVRAVELFGTMGYLARAGMYTPDELAQRLAAGETHGGWIVGETLRLRCLLLCLRRLIDGLDSGAVRPLDYAGLVFDLARTFGTAVVARPGGAPS